MIVDILEEHLDDAVDLAARRLAAGAMLDLTLGDLVELESRLRASVGGLLLGEDAAWELCRPLLAGGEPAERYVAAIVAFEGVGDERLESFEAAVMGAEGDDLAALSLACRATAWSGIDAYRRRLPGHGDPRMQAIGIDVLSASGSDVRAAVIEALPDAEGPLLTAVLRAAGRLRIRQLVQVVDGHAISDSSAVAGVALDSLARLDTPLAQRRCRELLEFADSRSAGAARILGVIGSEGDARLLGQATRCEDLRVAREAILALGNLGSVAASEALAPLLSDESLAPLASFALSRIYGEVAMQTIDPDRSSGKAPAEEDGEETWNPDSDLPVVSQPAFEAWWVRNRVVHVEGGRLRNGQPFHAAATSLVTPVGMVELEELEHALSGH